MSAKGFARQFIRGAIKGKKGSAVLRRKAKKAAIRATRRKSV